MSRRRVVYFMAAGIALVTVIVYLSALRNDFVNWDDDGNIYDNLRIRMLGVTFFLWALSDISLSFWQPLNWISFALDYAVWGLNPSGYHLTNVLLHAANTFLVVFLIIRLLEISNRTAARSGLAPFMNERSILVAGGVAGLLFGIHPLHVESVAWVTGRTDLLCSLFYLSGILAYTDYVSRSKDDEPSQKAGPFAFRRKYLLTAVFLVCALASKPIAMTFPAVLLLLDWYPFRRIGSLKSGAAIFTEKIPFFALSLIVSVVTVIAERKAELMASLENVSLLTRVFVMFKALALYLWKLIAPLHLVPLYPYPDTISPFSLEYLTALAVVIAILTICIFLAKKQKIFLAVFLFFFITLLPVLGLVKVRSVFMADRYTYLPSIGPFLLAGLLAAKLWYKAEALGRGPTVRGIAIFTAISLIGAVSYLTLKQIAVWKDSVAFWSYIIEKEPSRIPFAYTNRGNAFKVLGQPDRALEDFHRAIEIDPKEYLAYNNRGMLLKERGDYEKAINDYTTAITLKPDYAAAYNNRGYALKEMGFLDRALDDYNKAIALKPVPSLAYVAYTNRGVVYKELGQLDHAVEDFTAAIALNPNSADAYTSRGFVYQEMGRFDQAVEDLNRAITRNPSSGDAYINRGVAFEQMNQLDRAIEDYGKAIALDPSDYLPYSNRGIVFSKMGMVDKAIVDYDKAISLNPKFVKAYIDRGDLYQKTGRTELAVRDYQKACELGSDVGCKLLRSLTH